MGHLSVIGYSGTIANYWRVLLIIIIDNAVTVCLSS